MSVPSGGRRCHGSGPVSCGYCCLAKVEEKIEEPRAENLSLHGEAITKKSAHARALLDSVRPTAEYENGGNIEGEDCAAADCCASQAGR